MYFFISTPFIFSFSCFLLKKLKINYSISLLILICKFQEINRHKIQLLGKPPTKICRISVDMFRSPLSPLSLPPQHKRTLREGWPRKMVGKYWHCHEVLILPRFFCEFGFGGLTTARIGKLGGWILENRVAKCQIFYTDQFLPNEFTPRKSA